MNPNSENAPIVHEQSIQTWSDFMALIPYLQNTRKSVTNYAIRRGVNASIISLSFSMVEGFLWNFIESNIYYIQQKKDCSGFTRRVLKDYLENKTWEFKGKIELCKILVDHDVTLFKTYSDVVNLRDLRNIMAHGGDISIVLDKDKLSYDFRKKIFKTVLVKVGKLSQHDTITKANFSEKLSQILSDEVPDYFFDKAVLFLKELNSIRLNEANKIFFNKHVFNDGN